MKHISLTFLLVIGLGSVGFSQTNTFPTTGNAGVGTIAPASLLEISSATGTATIVPTTLTITSTSNNSDWSTTIPWANIDFYSKDASGTGASVRARIGAIMASAAGGNTELVFFTNNGTALSERARIDYVGNFGIGTQNPLTTLDVQAGSASLGIRSINTTAGSGSGGGVLAVASVVPSADQRLGIFAFGAYNSGSTYKYAANISGYASEGWTPTANGSYITFSTMPNGTITLTEKMRIDNAGNVSIGTTDAHGNKLAVNGSAIATSMTVQPYANWPDYVFKKQYKLSTLQEVKTYIDQNHHLSEIPTEAQVKKDGINLGEMNGLLVKKVEELTLYLIDQQKLLKQQELTIEAQKNKSRQLEKRMSRLESSLKSNP